MTKRLVTAEDLIEAAERNGYKQSKNGWFKYEHGIATGNSYGTPKNLIVEACFMGQVAINLGVDYGDLKYELDIGFNDLGSDIIRWNDGLKQSYGQILSKFKNRVEKTRSFKPVKIDKKKYNAKRKDEL